MTGPLAWQVGLMFLVVAAIYSAVQLTAIRNFELPDADDVLRLIQLRDLVNGQSWFDLVQHRVNPPQGVLMHWSRLVDLPLLLVYSLLALIVRPHLAEQATLVIVPLLTMGLALLLAARLAWRLIDERLVPYVGLLLGLSIPLGMQLSPMRIDHHGWQIVAVLGAANGLAARDPRRGAALMALALGLGMAISIELLPVTGLFAAILGLRWLRESKQRVWLAVFLPSLVLTGGAALLATHGLTDLADHCDTLSPAYLVGLAAAALGVIGLAGRPPLQPLLLAGGLVLCAMAAVGVFLTMAPDCSTGPFPMLDPLVQRMWYANVTEGMPIWRAGGSMAVLMLLGPVIGGAAVLRLIGRSRDWLRLFWIDYAILLGGLFALAIFVTRSASFAAAVALPPAAWLMRELHIRATRLTSAPGRIGALLAIALLAVPLIPVAAFQMVFAAQSQGGPAPAKAPQQVCAMPAAAPALRALDKATIFAPYDLGPMVLAYSPHSVVATAHHRGAAGIHDVLQAFLAPPDQARTIIASHRAAYVLVCPGMNEVTHYTAAAPHGLMAILIAGQAPAWLVPVPLSGNSGLRLWRVEPKPSALHPGSQNRP